MTYWIVTAKDSEPFGSYSSLAEARAEVKRLRLAVVGYSILSCEPVDDDDVNDVWSKVEHLSRPE